MVSLADERSHATGVSADGSVIVGRVNEQAFRWTQEDGILCLGYLPVTGEPRYMRFSRAYAVSADGSVIVGESDVGLFGGSFG